MKNTIMPGEALTTEEEFLAGKNTFVENGLIKSTTLGNANLDNATKEAWVDGKSVNPLKEGDIAFGVVTNVKDNTVRVELKKAEGDKRVTKRDAQIPVRNISNEFVSRTRDFFRIGDIVKAKIASVSEYGIDLETKGKGLGVIKAYCSNCRHEMVSNQEKLRCLDCGSVESRKWFEKEDEYKPRERSESSGFRGRDSRGFGSRDSRSGPTRSFGNRDGNSGGRRNFNSDRRNNFRGR